MPRLPHPTAPASPAQSLATFHDEWNSSFLPRLPASLDLQARNLGAFQRQRAFSSPTDLLRGLLAYGLGTTSFRQLGAWATLTGLASIAAKSWRQRLLQASPFLAWLLAELLAQAPCSPLLSQRLRGQLLLLDATLLARPASHGTGSGWRVHTAYNLLTGRIAQVSVTDQHGAESLRHYTIPPESILIADGGYGSRAAVGVARAAQAHLVARVHLNSFPFEQADGTRVDTLRWLQQPGRNQRSVTLWCTSSRLVDGQMQSSRHQVRLLAQRLPSAARRAAERRLRRNAGQHGRQVSERGLYLAGWVLIVTTLAAEEWPDEQVWQLYRARWQIELLFKRLKQLLRAHSVRASTAASATASIRALLVTWALIEGVASELQGRVQSETRGQGQEPRVTRDVSQWRVYTLAYESVRSAIVGQWSVEQLLSRAAQLQRYLIHQSGRQPNQTAALVNWLSGRCDVLPEPRWTAQTARLY